MTTDLWYQLPPDMNAWNNAVIENVSQKLPTITNYIAGIEWNKLDPATGDADGVIQLLNGMCAAPITIRGAKLAPIDVIATNYGSEPKFYPLSDTFLQKIYADNVVGKPVEKGASDEEDYVGPSVRIKHIRTVDNVKYASPEAANNMLDTIIKSASVSNWMAENMPELIVALSNRAADINEKLANVDVELPELMMVWKENDNYFANGKQVSSEVVSDFCKMANATIEERQGLMSGVPIIRDSREKIASIHIPTEQEVIAVNIEDGEDLFSDSTTSPVAPKLAVTTAYLKDGSSRRGLIFAADRLNTKAQKNTVENINPQDDIPEVKPTEFTDLYKPELFICSDGYGISPNIKTDARIEVSLDMVKKLSAVSEPAIGMVGVYIDNSINVFFGRIEDVMVNGEIRFLRMYDLINHTLSTVTVKDMSGQFYEVTDERLPVVSKTERTKYVSLTGVNGILTRNSEGRLVLDGESHSVVNCPFALMNKYAAAYEDAVKICKIASTLGKCEFEAFEPVEKSASPVESGENDTRKKNNKNTKTGTDDEPQGQGNQFTIPQTTPEAAMSVDLQNDPQYGFRVQGNVPGAGQGTSPNNGQPGAVEPISSKDLENVVQLNSPKVMDAYVMAGLAQGGLTSQENLLRTSDVIVTALEHLSKLLFLSRQGSLEFVDENDIQSAMQKLNDVVSSIGVQTSRIAQ